MNAALDGTINVIDSSFVGNWGDGIRLIDDGSTGLGLCASVEGVTSSKFFRL